LSVNWPLASVVVQPICCLLCQIQNQSTSNAHTCAPGTGRPLGQRTVPVMTKSRHQRRQIGQKWGGMRSALSVAWGVRRKRLDGTAADTLSSFGKASSSASSGPMTTRAFFGTSLSPNVASGLPAVLTTCDCNTRPRSSTRATFTAAVVSGVCDTSMGTVSENGGFLDVAMNVFSFRLLQAPAW
jgi:hypothetical protein